MCSKAANCIEHLFTLASRQRCISNFKRYPVANLSKISGESEAVLLPICRVEGIPSLLYTVRTENLRFDKGEITFPGGMGKEDETPEESAIRGTEEIIGLSPDKVEVWGHGPAFPLRDNISLVTPVIASVNDLNETQLCMNKDSVDEVFTVALELLCDPSNQYCSKSHGFILPVFTADKYVIRGLTAYITHVFLNCALSKEVYNNDIRKRKTHKDINKETPIIAC